MEFTLEALAKLAHSEYQGNQKIILKGVAALHEAAKGDVSFVSNPKYKKYLSDTKATVVVLSADLAKDYAGNALIAKDPYITFAKIVSLFHPTEKIMANTHSSAVVDKTARIGEGVRIAANVVIESDVVIGDGVSIGAGCFIGKHSILEDNTLLYPNVTLYSDTKIGKAGIIHSGVVIGSDGFGFALEADKSWYKIKQIGNVVLGDNVEIGANTTIDRAALGSTIISNGVKIDNQVIIGHNVMIKEYAILAGGVGIAGSTTIGKRCQLGGNVGVAGHINIADDVIITGRSMVIGSITKSGVYSSGVTTEENRKWRRNAARFRQLDTMAKTLKRIEKICDSTD